MVRVVSQSAHHLHVHSGSLIGRPTLFPSYSKLERQDTHTHTHTHAQAGRKAGRQTDRQTETHIEKPHRGKKRGILKRPPGRQTTDR